MRRVMQRAIRDYDFREYLFNRGEWREFVRRDLIPFCGCDEYVLSHRVVFAYWWSGITNFGDLLTPALLSHYGYVPLHTSPSASEFVSVGSILHYPGFSESYRGIILGTGVIRKGVSLSFPKATILALRGRHTLELLGVQEDILLADPGLLSHKLVDGNSLSKQYELGIVPHYVDKDSSVVRSLKTRFADAVMVIDVQRRPVEVIRDINRCQCILSSSLHGLIAADSLGIPNRRWLGSGLISGGDFKYNDYYSAFDDNEKRAPVQLSGSECLEDVLGLMLPVPRGVREKQEQLDFLFSRLPEYLPSGG
jgi:pyruvyltransferase